jgi:hypothetical protein
MSNYRLSPPPLEKLLSAVRGVTPLMTSAASGWFAAQDGHNALDSLGDAGDFTFAGTAV